MEGARHSRSECAAGILAESKESTEPSLGMGWHIGSQFPLSGSYPFPFTYRVVTLHFPSLVLE
jgi:hypothetical protein